MRLRDLFVGVGVLCVAVVHFVMQWVGWKGNLGDAAVEGALLGLSGDGLWSVLSFPLFSIVSRAAQHEYFFGLLVGNSILWGFFVVQVTTRLNHAVARRFRKRRASRPAPPLNEAEQLAELRWMSERGLISHEQYRLRREVILAQSRGYPSTAGSPKPGTRLEPRRDDGLARSFDQPFAPARPASRGFARR
jgi:uncharacterized membrane protein